MKTVARRAERSRHLIRIILVRHGETDWNQARRIQGGGSNIPLNEMGRRQAESIALRLKPEKIQAVYSSPLQRALDTAQASARYHQLEVEVEAALREIEVGELEGLHVAEVGKRLDLFLTTGGQDEVPPRMPGGESLTEVQQRGWSAIQRLADKHADGVLVVVSHYFVILTIICSVLNLPLSQIGRLWLDAGSISTISFDEQVTRLLSFNDSYHLKDS